MIIANISKSILGMNASNTISALLKSISSMDNTEEEEAKLVVTRPELTFLKYENIQS